MAKYVEVVNNSGTVTIDDTHPRLVKTRTVSITAGRTIVPAADYYYIKGYIDNKYILGSYCIQRVNLNSNEKIVAVRAKKAHDNVAVLGGFISSSKYQVTLCGSVANTNTYENDYLLDIYGTVPSSGGTNSGLEIFNASGTKIFDSDFYTMDVVGTFSVVNKDYKVFTNATTSYSMGGHSVSNRAVAINSCINSVYLHPKTQGTPWGTLLYGVVFGSTIHLELRLNEYMTWLTDGGGTTPHGYSCSSSGVILNTKNI